MYQYGYPNLQRFLEEGSVAAGQQPGRLHARRHGPGRAHACTTSSRILGWSVVQQGPPAHFIRTGPIWKGWLYYVDFTAEAWFRLGGVQGERLLAYGSSDLGDTSIDMLTSSDWEGARDGVDDANLARMVQWYLPRLKTRAEGAWRKRLEAIEAEQASWFTEKGPLPIGRREVHYHHEPKDGPTLDYRYLAATAESTQAIETAKRYMLGILKEMAAHVSPADVQVEWHDVVLVRDGQPKITLVHSPGSPAAKDGGGATGRAVCAALRRDPAGPADRRPGLRCRTEAPGGAGGGRAGQPWRTNRAPTRRPISRPRRIPHQTPCRPAVDRDCGRRRGGLARCAQLAPLRAAPRPLAAVASVGQTPRCSRRHETDTGPSRFFGG